MIVLPWFKFVLILIIILASLGIGAVIEQTEYIGFLKFGEGSGLLRVGGLGDTQLNEDNLRAMDIVGGGWINANIFQT